MTAVVAASLLLIFHELWPYLPESVRGVFAADTEGTSGAVSTPWVLVFILVLLWALYQRVKSARAQRNELEDILNSINPDILLATDQAKRIFLCTDAAKRMLDYSKEELIDQPLDKILDFEKARPVTPVTERSASLAAGETGRLTLGVAQGKARSGARIPLEVIRGRLQTRPGEVMLLRDITERKKQEAENEKLAQNLAEANERLNLLVRVDPLTRLLNRRGFEEVLGLESRKAVREGAPVAAMLLDCDNFKGINDSMGYSVGNLVLQEVARQLKGSVRETDHVARIGGDEFLVLLPDTRMAEAAVVAERARLAVRRLQLDVSGQRVELSVSVGLAAVSHDATSTEEVLNLTTVSLKRSKSLGKNRISIVQSGENVPDEGTLPPETAQEEILSGKCLYALAQPIVRLEDRTPLGYELLIRSSLPTLQRPDELFQFAVENDIIDAVDLQCLKVCAAEVRRGGGNLRWHMNVFPSTLVSIPVDTMLAHILQVDCPERICIELSQQQFVGDPKYLKEPITAMKQAGLSIAVDDLGFGRSSLESLILLEPDIVKIDGQYVQGVSRDPAKRKALERMRLMAQSLSATQIIEGVESEEDLEVIEDLGFRFAQGYLFGYPESLTPDT